METENDLLNLLLKSPNSESILTIAEQLEVDHNFSFTKDRKANFGTFIFTDSTKYICDFE